MDGVKTAFRLRGEVDGRTFVAALERGVNAIGSRTDCDVLLPAAGVSRRHAEIEVVDQHLVVKDLASKNGVFVNALRVDEAELHVGDRVHIGPVLVMLEEVDADDIDVAISLVGAADEVASPAETGEMTLTVTRTGEQRLPLWATAVHAVLDGLSGPTADLREAADRLRGLLRADGVCFVVWDGRTELVVLATSGRLLPLESDDGAVALFKRAVSTGRAVSGCRPDPGPGIVLSAVGRTAAPAIGTIVVGSGLDEEQVVPLVEIVTRLVAIGFDEVPARSGRTAEVQPLDFPDGFVVGHSSAITQLYREIQQAVPGKTAILITGETGVGKELVARLLHRSSDRRHAPFVAVNCAAIPADLLEAELFGIERGVATGVERRQGTFQLADGGVLFLDEVGDMSPGLQSKMLRALQEREVQPVGATHPRSVDVRIVAATNADLKQRIADGSFRSDLYYRIAGHTLKVPPLRRRREDIAELVEHFMRRATGESGRSIRGITVKALRTLVDAPWPGNVRELENEVVRLVSLCAEGSSADSSLLSAEVLHPDPALGLQDGLGDGELDLEHAFENVERRLIGRALARTRGNRTKAAKLLGISRNGLALKMTRLGLEW